MHIKCAIRPGVTLDIRGDPCCVGLVGLAGHPDDGPAVVDRSASACGVVG